MAKIIVGGQTVLYSKNDASAIWNLAFRTYMDKIENTTRHTPDNKWSMEFFRSTDNNEPLYYIRKGKSVKNQFIFNEDEMVQFLRGRFEVA